MNSHAQIAVKSDLRWQVHNRIQPETRRTAEPASTFLISRTINARHSHGGRVRPLLVGPIKGVSLVCLSLAITVLLSGCQHPAHATKSEQIIGPKLSTGSIVYVAVPSDAFYKKNLAIDSGRQTAELVRNHFAKYARRAFVGRQVETFAEALETARKYNCTYLSYPWLLQWEDHSTEFSGIRDKVEIKLEVADVSSGNILHATTIQGAGPWLASGGESPRDILTEPVAKYIGSLFQVIHTPTALPK